MKPPFALDPDADNRVSVLAERQLALGGPQTWAWNGMRVTPAYAGDPFDEVLAVRTRAGLFDISAHKIIDVRGPDAVAVLDRMLACRVADALPGTAQAGGLLDDEGGFIDDLLVLCCGADHFRLSHGSGATAEALAQAGRGADVSIEPDPEAHLLSLQGPRAEAILAPHTPADLARLGHFQHCETRLFGVAVRLMRGGYTGEAGFEVECRAGAAGAVWDAILAAGRSAGVRPAGWACLETLRIEAGLPFYPFDMPLPHTTPWEIGMGWVVARDKPAFRGRTAVLAAEGRARTLLVGLAIDHDAAVAAGATVLHAGRRVGVVTSAVFSRYLMSSIALAALAPEACAAGTPVAVAGAAESHSAHVARLPFYDPLRLRMRRG